MEIFYFCGGLEKVTIVFFLIYCILVFHRNSVGLDFKSSFGITIT